MNKVGKIALWATIFGWGTWFALLPLLLEKFTFAEALEYGFSIVGAWFCLGVLILILKKAKEELIKILNS